MERKESELRRLLSMYATPPMIRHSKPEPAYLCREGGVASNCPIKRGKGVRREGGLSNTSQVEQHRFKIR